MEFAGTILLVLVAGQLALFGYSSFRQMRGAERQRRLEQELLARQIEAANVLRRRREEMHLHWNGCRKFTVERIVDEAERVRSFYLTPHDRKPLPAFKAGQYLTFRLDLPDEEKPVVRCYSLSDSYRPQYYRVTIKQVLSPPQVPDAPPGKVSTFFHRDVRPGDILDVQAPRGQFTLDLDERRPAVLIAGGVGITPLFCMAKSVAEAGSDREVLLLYGVRHGGEHALKAELQELNEAHENIHVFTWYSHPRDEDQPERDFRSEGHVTIEALKDLLETNNCQFYLCGPPPMMSALIDGLKGWGVPKRDILTEAFGAPTVKKAMAKPEAAAGKPAAAALSEKTQCRVTFGRSGKTLTWDGSCQSLLDFAEQHGISIESGCRAGNCATCLVAVKAGRVHYVTEHGAEPEEGSCLTCIAVPEEDLTLDA